MRTQFVIVGLGLMALCDLGARAGQSAVAGSSDVYVIPFSHLDLFWAGSREECLSRGTRFVSVKVARGDEITSLNYPPAGTYVFRYSLSSSPGDWKAAKAYRTGLGWNTPLLPISVADDITGKTLPPTQSFCSWKPGGLVLSSLKKADRSSSIVVRLYEMEGTPAETPVVFLGRLPVFSQVNLLEEELNQKPQQTLHIGPYGIETIRFSLDHKQQ